MLRPIVEIPLVQWFDHIFINAYTPGGLVSIPREGRIMRIKRENAYKRSATWCNEYRQAWIP